MSKIENSIQDILNGSSIDDSIGKMLEVISPGPGSGAFPGMNFRRAMNAPKREVSVFKILRDNKIFLQQFVKLLRDQKLTIGEIASEYNIPKSVVRKWTRNQDIRKLGKYTGVIRKLEKRYSVKLLPSNDGIGTGSTTAKGEPEKS